MQEKDKAIRNGKERRDARETKRREGEERRKGKGKGKGQESRKVIQEKQGKGKRRVKYIEIEGGRTGREGKERNP